LNRWKSANSRMHDSFVAMSDEWQAFIGRRMKQDLHLWQDLAGAKTPDAIWSAYAGFWQKAVEDYWQEYAAFTKLSGSLVPHMAVGPEAREGMFPQAKAA